MSLVRTALRLGAIAALQADPVIAALCPNRVYDSLIDEIDSRAPVPVLIVYTDDDSGKAWSVNNGGPPFKHTCDFVIEISMKMTAETGNGIVIGSPATDPEMEWTLDLLEDLAVQAVTIADTPAAVLLNQVVIRRVTDLKSMRFASAETGAKVAMRIVTLTTELIGNQPDVLNPPTGTLATLPEPLRSVALSLSPTSTGYATCVAIASRFAPVTDAVLAGIDATVQPFAAFDPANPPSPTGPYPAGVVVPDPISATLGLPSP